ncbi:hypothetical protein N9B10_06315, partial [Pirellulales bacterium]|nr:hypothetical protein [Pirellulales bacterium]
MNEFAVIDVENGMSEQNEKIIYQIGVCHFVNDQVQEKWSQFLNPECKLHIFEKFVANYPDDIQKYPSLPVVIDELKQRIESKILWSHGPTDKQKIGENLMRYDLNDLEPNGWHD